MVDEELLKISLLTSVPLWIEQFKRAGDMSRVMERAKVCSQVIAEKGDIIQFRSKKKGETAAAFNRLAEGLACLAFFPGGVDAFGLHFEAKMDVE